MRVGRKPAGDTAGDIVDGAPARRGRAGGAPGRANVAEPPTRPARQRGGSGGRRPQELRARRQSPETAPTPRPVDRPARPKTASQAKARAKARKAKAPKAIRLPLRERLIARLANVDLHPRTLLAKIPFVVLVIGSLAVGLAITLWLSTDAAQRSYQLGSARSVNDALLQQKESLERDVLEAESAPALADAARNLGMIPSRDTAHLVQDPAGNWVVVGEPKPAEGASPPPLNSKLPDEKPPAPVGEVPVVVPPQPNPFSAHVPGAPAQPGPAPLLGPVGPAGPVGPTAQGGLVLVPVAPPAAGGPLAPLLAPLAPLLAPPPEPAPPPPPVGPVLPEAPVVAPPAGGAPQ